MYKIIGADRKEHGPVTADQVRQWIAAGRCTNDTLARLEGTTSWRPLILFPEFSSSLADAPRPRTVTSATPNIPPLTVTKPAGKSLSVLRILMIIVAVIVGGVVLLGVATVVLVPNIVRARQRALTIQCRNNLQTLATTIRAYATEHGNNLPIPSAWVFQLKTRKGFESGTLICPANPQQTPSYAFNEKLIGRSLSNMNPKTVLLFESNTSANGAARGVSEMCCRGHSLLSGSGPRTREKVFLVALLDGTVISVPESQLSTLRWDP